MLISIYILLSVDVIGSIICQPCRSEVTEVTHCTHPLDHTVLSRKIGSNGAVDFVKYILSLSPRCF